MAMSDWQAAFLIWMKRRRRFAEEWTFHRDAAIAEFESMGCGRWRACQMARRRMGARFRYRSEALRAVGGDFHGLFLLLPVRYITRSPFFVPAALVVGITLALLLNPERSVALQCIWAMLLGDVSPKIERMIPLTPPGVAPVSLAGALVRVLAIAGTGWAVTKMVPRSLPAFLYSVVVLCVSVLAWAVVWVTGMQVLASRTWGHDRIQIFALLAFLFGFVGMLYAAMRLWWIDVEGRCPYCLRRPGMPETRGNTNDVLVDPLETESICFRGHGVLLESRWRRRFDAAPEGVR